MGELLDRAFQREILGRLSESYPRSMHPREFDAPSANQLTVNLCYLHEHGLITLVTQRVMSGEVHLGMATATARGLDFLQDDGGLSAILGVVTVKLHDDTIRNLLIQRIEATPGDKSTKDLLIKKIKALPADALGKLTIDGLGAALAKAPDVLHLIGNLLS